MGRTSVLVTGASGFIGRCLMQSLARLETVSVTGSVRGGLPDLGEHLLMVGDINGATDWTAALKAKQIVIHTAGRAHKMEGGAESMAEFRRINVEGTLNLAYRAEEAGVRRFIFLSSIGVNGAVTRDRPFNEGMPPAPHADYAISKFEAEECLRKVAKETNMEVVIIRPPLVYAGDAPGNFHRLLNLVAKSVPLPLGSIRNLRSLVARENLLDFIHACMSHPKAANETFVIADGEDISTPHLIELLAEGMGKSPRLLPFPVSLLKLGAAALGRRSMYQQLCGSLQVDITKAQNLLRWKPVISVSEALRKAAQDFMRRQAGKSA